MLMAWRYSAISSVKEIVVAGFCQLRWQKPATTTLFSDQPGLRQGARENA
jgi:hypothetical protein